MPKPIELEQGSEEWLAYRINHLGGSDAPVLMGDSPFRTPFQLWEEKQGKPVENQVSHFVHAKADTIEEIVRDKYNVKLNSQMKDAIFEEGFMHASLDGYDETLAGAIEIKMANAEDHKNVRYGDIPQKYIWQIVHQLIVCPIQWVDYCSYYVDPDESDLLKGDLQIVRTYFSKSGQLREIYLDKAKQFWEMVQSQTPPPFTDSDWVPITDDELKDKFLRLKFESQILKEKERIVEGLKADIKSALDVMPMKRYATAQVKVTRVEREGNIDYKRCVKTLGVSEKELEEFKKPGSSYYKFTFEKPQSHES